MKMERQLAHPLPTSPFRSDVLNGRVVLITGCVHVRRCASSRVLITCGYVSVVLILILLFLFLPFHLFGFASGATGIGYGCAETFGKHGAKVAIMGRRKLVLEQAVARLVNQG